MPTVIDSLIVLLKLDPSQFTEGQRAAAAELGRFTDRMGATMEQTGRRQKRLADDETKRSKEREAYNRRIAESYRQVTDQVIRFGAAVIGVAGVTDFIKSTVQMDSSLGRFAERLDLNKDQLSLWVAMVTHMGVSTKQAAADVQQAASALNTVRFQYQIGDTSKTGVIQALGLSMADLQDPLQALDKIHQSILAKRMTARQATPLLQMLGLSDSMISLLEQPGARFDQIRAQAQKEAPATRQQMDDAEKATEAMGRLDDVLRRIAGDAAGPLATALTKIADIAEKFPDATKAVVDLTVAVLALKSAAVFIRLLMGAGGAGAAGGAAAGAAEAGAGVGLGVGAAAAGAALAGGAALSLVPGRLGTLGQAAKGRSIDEQLAGLRSQLGTDAPQDYVRRRIADLEAKRAILGGKADFATPVQAATQSSIAVAAEAFFRQHGASAATAKGIGAGIYAEGGSLGYARNGAFGIGQWRGARRRALFRFSGTDHPTLDQQLEFLMAEMIGTSGETKAEGADIQHTAGGYIRNARTAAEAARAYIARNMRPGMGIYGDFRRAGRYLGEDLGGPSGGELAAAGAKVDIGTIIIQTKATDARGIGKEIAAEVVAQTSRGLS